MSEVQTGDKAHGRRTRRHLQASSRLAKHLNWPGLAQVCRGERTTFRDGETTVEVPFAVTSVLRERADAAKRLACWRGHWHIENWLPWIRDVVYGEDRCQVRRGHGLQNLAALRSAAINLLRLCGLRPITPNLRRFACHPRKRLRFLGILKN